MPTLSLQNWLKNIIRVNPLVLQPACLLVDSPDSKSCFNLLEIHFVVLEFGCSPLLCSEKLLKLPKVQSELVCILVWWALKFGQKLIAVARFRFFPASSQSEQHMASLR